MKPPRRFPSAPRPIITPFVELESDPLSRAQLAKLLQDIRSSYWFIPSAMVAMAIMLSFLTVWIDSQIGNNWPRQVVALFASQPDGARSILSTVAGSMITVAGVTFSLTLLAVSHASIQLGPRLLNNFMRDRGNQITLGTFVSTFIYCLMILRTVKSSEPGVSELPADAVGHAFVPQLSILVALALTLCSVGVLIYFIHHVPESIRMSHVLAGVGRDLLHSIETIFPERLGDSGQDSSHPDPVQPSPIPASFEQEAVAICLDRCGYVQTLNESGLEQLANEHDLIIRLDAQPGDFYTAHTPALQAWPPERVSDTVKRHLSGILALGSQRTLSQNVMFGVQQLVEVAQRALSPGVNDPRTAENCANWLGAAVIKLADRKLPGPIRYDDTGHPRIITQAITFEDFCDEAFGSLMQYVSEDENATRSLLRVLSFVQQQMVNGGQRATINRFIGRLQQAQRARQDGKA